MITIAASPRLFGLTVLVLVGLVPPPSVAAQSASYIGGITYSRGSYVFDQTTQSVWLSNGLSLRWRGLSLSATLPVIVQNSTLVSFVGGQPLPTGGEEAEAVRRRRPGETIESRRGGQGGNGGGGPGAGAGGRLVDESADTTLVVFRDSFEMQVGDPFMSGALTVYSGTGLLRSVGLQVAAKAPLRSIESGVGTGAWDMGVGTSAVVGGGGLLAFADVSYWSFGDLPDMDLDPVWTWATSLSRAFSGGRLAVTASFTGSTSFVPSVEAPRSLGAGVLVFSPSGRSLSLGVAVGLSEAAPDLSVSMGWSVPLN